MHAFDDSQPPGRHPYVPTVTVRVWRTDPDTLAAVVWRASPLADAQRAGRLTIEGDKAAVERFLRLFPMPAPAAVDAAD
jgi:hypothetical protein